MNALSDQQFNQLVLQNGNYEKQDSWVLDTVGSNLKDILTMDEIDQSHTTSNNIQEVYRVLGIEAARQSGVDSFAGANFDSVGDQRRQCT